MSTSRRGVPGLLALLTVALHVPVLHRYGYEHDELYFLASGRHLALGYVDNPPVVYWLARLSDAVFGPWLPGLRLWATLAGAATVFLTATLARRLGGGGLAQFLAGFAVVVAPVYLRTGNQHCFPAFEPLVWVLAAHLLVTIVTEEHPRCWLWFGLVAGVGLMIKHTTLLLGLAVLVGLLATPARRHLRSPWPYAGAAVALVVFLPNLLWQASHGWPTVEFLRELNAAVSANIPRSLFLAGQVLYLNPVTAPLWLLGLLFFFRPAGRPWRFLGWLYVVPLVFFVFTRSKVYYLAPAYPTLLAGGGVAFEKWLGSGRPRLVGAAVSVVLLLAGGVLLAPLSLPILSIRATDRYVRAFTFGATDKLYELTGDLHGMFGWHERVEAIGGVWNSLSQEERSRTAIFSGSYGPAAAVDYFGSAYGLPAAFSGHINYYLWGPPPRELDTWLVVDVSERGLAPYFEYFEEITIGADVELEDVNPWERRFVVLVCRRPKVDLREAWPRLRRWFTRE